MSWLSGENATDWTQLEWPSRFCFRTPVFSSQRRTELCYPPTLTLNVGRRERIPSTERGLNCLPDFDVGLPR